MSIKKTIGLLLFLILAFSMGYAYQNGIIENYLNSSEKNKNTKEGNVLLRESILEMNEWTVRKKSKNYHCISDGGQYWDQHSHEWKSCPNNSYNSECVKK
ncbi:MAG: hypothetical protein ABEH43_00205, partial [Flavobacteriales bacterium]